VGTVRLRACKLSYPAMWRRLRRALGAGGCKHGFLSTSVTCLVICGGHGDMAFVVLCLLPWRFCTFDTGARRLSSRHHSRRLQVSGDPPSATTEVE